MSDPRNASGGLPAEEARQVARIRRGSAEAFEAFFRLHEPLAYSVCLSLVGAHSVARDLVQDLFCDLWDRRQHLNPQVSLKAYLAGAARNKALIWLRKDQAHESLGEWNEAHRAEHPKTNATPQDVLQHKDLRQALRQAVEELPRRRRLIYKMAREEHLSYAEIAAALGISVNTVKTQMGRALKFLRRRLKIYYFASKTN